MTIKPGCSPYNFPLTRLGTFTTGPEDITLSIDTANTLAEENENNNTLTKTFSLIFPEPIYPDISVDILRYDDTTKTIISQVCRTKGEKTTYTKVPLSLTLANKTYTITNSLNLSKDTCILYKLAVPSTLPQGHYTIRATLRPPVSLSEQPTTNNTMTMTFPYKPAEQVLPTETPNDITIQKPN